MSALRILPSHQTYDSLLQRVHSTHETLKQAWIAHVQAVEELQASGLWQAYAPTWEAYCSKDLGLMPYRSSTYRAYQLDVPFALLANTLDFELSQHESRKLRETIEKVCKDAPLEQQIASYTEAAKITGKAIPTIGELSAAYSEVKRFYSDNVVTVNDVDVSVKDALSQSIAYAIYENGERQKGHIETSTGKESKRLKIEQIAPFLEFAKLQGIDLSEIDLDLIEGGSLVVYQRTVK